MKKLILTLTFLVLAAAAQADLGDPLASSLNAAGDAVNRPLTLAQGQAMLDHFGLAGLPAATSQNVQDGLEAVIHAKGANFNLTTPASAANWLEGSSGHGALFELEAARFLQTGGGNVVFARTGNPGVDLVLTQGPGEPVSFFQVKAWQDAKSAATETLLDGLTFAGGNPVARVPQLTDGSIRFSGLLPEGQVDELKLGGQLLADGSPSPAFQASIIEETTLRAAVTGDNALRLRAALPDAQALLPRMTLGEVPITHDALLDKTAQVAGDLRRADELRPLAGAESTVETVSQIGSEGEILALGGTIGALGAGFDGTIDLYTGIQHDDPEKLTIGGVKTAAAIAMGAGTATGQPEVVVPAAIVYGGAVVTDVAYENRVAIGEFVSRASVSARENLNDAAWAIFAHIPDTIKDNPYFQESVSWFHGF